MSFNNISLLDLFNSSPTLSNINTQNLNINNTKLFNSKETFSSLLSSLSNNGDNDVLNINTSDDFNIVNHADINLNINNSFDINSLDLNINNIDDNLKIISEIDESLDFKNNLNSVKNIDDESVKYNDLDLIIKTDNDNDMSNSFNSESNLIVNINSCNINKSNMEFNNLSLNNLETNLKYIKNNKKINFNNDVNIFKNSNLNNEITSEFLNTNNDDINNLNDNLQNIEADISENNLQESNNSYLNLNNFDDANLTMDNFNDMLQESENCSSNTTSSNNDIFNQVKDGISGLSGSKHIKLQLKPQGLGNVGINMKFINGKLELIFTVDNSLVEETLLSNINQLESLLCSSGVLSVNEITIKKRDDNKSSMLLKNKYIKNTKNDILGLKIEDSLNQFMNK